MDEIISAVQVIKLFAWETPFAKLIGYIRKKELNVIKKASYIRALHMTSMLFTQRLALFSTLSTFVLLNQGKSLTADMTFVISSYFIIVAHGMSQRFSRSIAETSEALVAFKRLEQFLDLDEKDTVDKNDTSQTPEHQNGAMQNGNQVRMIVF